jgi:hypothetical protein
MKMADVATLVDNYIATWNERDSRQRRALIAETFTEDADYLDPLMRGEGQEGIDAMISGVQQQYGEYRFELADGPDAHNDRVRFTWHLVHNGDEVFVATGYDFGTLAQDGRLQSVTGFLETPGQ